MSHEYADGTVAAELAERSASGKTVQEQLDLIDKAVESAMQTDHEEWRRNVERRLIMVELATIRSTNLLERIAALLEPEK